MSTAGKRAARMSIVTPSFNQRAYLCEALESVGRQRWRGETEHIVCDGGSTDGTVELLASSKARWVSEPDSGQSEALNKGFAMAQGDIIGWLNADDFYLKGALNSVAEHFESHADTDVLYADCLFVDSHGSLLRGKAEHPFSVRILRHYGCFVPSIATFFHRRLLDEGLLRIDETLHFAMDYELFMRLADAGVRFAYLPGYLAGFRWHESNKSLDDKRRFDERRAIQRAYGVRAPDREGPSTSDKLWRVVHLMYKAAAGGLARQARVRTEVGSDMRWWLVGDE